MDNNVSLMTNGSFVEGSRLGDNVTLILLAIVLGFLILVTIIGNVFVIAAIVRERNLQSVANYLIVSLAVADLMVACLVMPLAAVYVINSGWFLGPVLCDIWTTSDVLCCTASILHLVAIAVDRYWTVTDVNYIQSRDKRIIFRLITTVWIVSLSISIAPQLGWKDPSYLDRIAEGKCVVSQDPAYQIFATCATFYLPLLGILALYWKIFQAARRRIRKRPGTTIQPPRERRGILRLVRRGPKEETTAFTIARSTPDYSSASPERSSHNGANPQQDQHQQQQQSSATNQSTTSLTTSTSAGTNVNSASLVTSVTTANATTTTTTTAAAAATATHTSSKRTRETIEAKRERKAAKTLAIITGAFVVCWLPFFVAALLQAICKSWEPSEVVANVFLWLGYFNSTLNPVIYTVFSPEFRQAFKRMLCGNARPGR